MKVLVAVAWPYVNGDIHVGHLGGYLLPADFFARYQRLIGNEVLMVSGSDCHGTPITVEADRLGKKPEDIVESYHKKDIKLFKKCAISYNIYTKTINKTHHDVVKSVFLKLLKNGYIKKGTTNQYFSKADNEFLPDRYVIGQCPHCGAEDQRSDQCESCGRWLEDGALINPKSKKTGAPVEHKESEHYFLHLEKFNESLKSFINMRKGVLKDWVYQESISWLNEGLQPRAITRDLDWGIPIPAREIKKISQELLIENVEEKRIYVWFEAVIGYLSAAILWSKIANGEIDEEDIIFSIDKNQSTKWEDYWKNPDAKHYYFMGQDNLIFHTLLWPAQIIGTKDDLNLPYNVVVNKFINYEGKKFSKSRNWIIDSSEIVDKYGLDPVRFYFAANLPENKESNFTWKTFIDSINNELVGNLGNFINRTLLFAKSKFGGKISNFSTQKEVVFEIQDAFNETSELIEKVNLTPAFERVFKLSRFGNRYFDREKPWELVKIRKNKAEEVIFNCIELINAIRTLIYPFLPDSSKKISQMIGFPSIKPKVGKNQWQYKAVSKGIKISDVEILFNKITTNQN